MAKRDNIAVPGYAKRVFFNDNIEYRNFSPDLVGNQLTVGDDGNSSLFTFGNFVITTNTEPRPVFVFPERPFSPFYTLNDIIDNDSFSLGNNSTGINGNQSQYGTITQQKITLNTDNSDLCNFAYFGSATEFIRVSLESIISKWPASIYCRPIDTETGSQLLNIQDYTYNAITNTSTFKILTNGFINNYDIIYDSSGVLLSNFSNELRNLTTNYKSYNILYNENEFTIIGLTPSETLRDSFIIVTVNGEIFPNATSQNLFRTIHIKPNSVEVEKFFATIEPFENNLLNRLTTPKYTSTFTYSVTTSTGIIYETEKTLTWPTSDGYNIDFNTNEYISFITDLLSITNSKDETKSNLMVRFLTAEAISNFDTVPRCDDVFEEETAGQKMNKTLKIYGRNFDEIKKYIDGISFATTVTYDRKNNTPDQVLKYLARVLGWELTSSILENDLIKSYLDTSEPSYDGQSRGLTPYEAEIELWRRLILNSAWLWKSKGTRKAVEFLFRFIGAPNELINLNEYVYVAKNRVNTDEFFDLAIELDLSNNIEDYYFDFDGFPSTKPDNPSMYFQKGGLWYRETGGQNASVLTSEGNNPHIGPYDGGAEYINNFRNLLPDFEPRVITNETTTTKSEQLFTNYNNGIVNNYSGDTFIGVETINGVSLDDCFVYEAEIVQDPFPENDLTECGCEIPTDDLAIHINVVRDDRTKDCDVNLSGYTFVNSENIEFNNKPQVYLWNYLMYNIDGTPSSIVNQSTFISPDCCRILVNGESYYHEEYHISESTGDAIFKNAGYVCCKPPQLIGIEYSDNKLLYDDPGKSGCGCYTSCKWRLAGPRLGDMEIIGDFAYLKFLTPKNNWGEIGEAEYRVTTESDSCFCPLEYTTPAKVLDPYTNKEGYGCRITKPGKAQLVNIGVDDTNGTINSDLYQLFYKKSIGKIPCNSEITPKECLISVSFNKTPYIRLKDNCYQINPLNIQNGTAPYIYFWEILEQSGVFYNYSINDVTSPTPIICKDPFGPASDGNLINKIVIRVTVVDSLGCRTQATFEEIVYS